jgi:hypothetical protein
MKDEQCAQIVQNMHPDLQRYVQREALLSLAAWCIEESTRCLLRFTRNIYRKVAREAERRAAE